MKRQSVSFPLNVKSGKEKERQKCNDTETVLKQEREKRITQIAEELEISPRTVEKHIEIALKKLRQELADYLPAGLLLWLLNI